MNRVTLKNFRCFREEQTARLAPLTLLVGGNSTGKTSFLALLRALWRVAVDEIVPDFREEPYDLGTFRDIAHYRGGRGGSADSFEAGLHYDEAQRRGKPVSFTVSFREREGVPYPTTRGVTGKEVSMEVETDDDGQVSIRFGRQQQTWQKVIDYPSWPNSTRLTPLRVLVRNPEIWAEPDEWTPVPNETQSDNTPTQSDVDELQALVFSLRQRLNRSRRHPFAGAPVRSHPRRTYDPTQPFQDSRGEYIPTYLASISRRNQLEWTEIKHSLENFGKNSGLFDEIWIESFGKTDADPFQVKIRKFGKRSKGGRRNLIDVGYGVSQSLPVLTELLRRQPPPLFLLQQPEVHLHPSAQAALGSLFCSIANQNRQLIVETHSDYIIDRVRMDVRDKKTTLKAADVSILYFETNDLDVKIHSLRLDENGNVLDTPPGYREFFMEELRRSINI